MGNKKHSNIPRLNFGSLNIQGGFLSKINLGDLSQYKVRMLICKDMSTLGVNVQKRGRQLEILVEL